MSARAEAKARLIAGVGGAALGALLGSLRFQVAAGAEHYAATWGARRAGVFALWHGRLLPAAYHHRRQGLAALISQHRDGEYIARIVEGWGITAIRGSSTRGGREAMAEIVQALRAGQGVAITPDGPRGPRQKMKLGSLRAAQAAGVPLMPVSAAADRAWWVEGWDRFLVPRPFARVYIGYAEPVLVARDADEAELQRLAGEVEARLNALTDALDRVAAGGGAA